MLMSVSSISSDTVMIFEFDWKPRCVMIISENWSAMSTFYIFLRAFLIHRRDDGAILHADDHRQAAAHIDKCVTHTFLCHAVNRRVEPRETVRREAAATLLDARPRVR